MRYSDIAAALPLIDVPRFPALGLVEPSLDELGELAQRFDAFDPRENREKSGEAVLWLFQSFVRSKDEGEPLEDVTTVDEALKVKPSLVRAITEALQGAQENEDPGPLEPPAS